MRTASAASAPCPLGSTTRAGTDVPGIGTVSNGPTATARRYEGSGRVLRNTIVRFPAAVLELSSGVFAKAASDSGTTSVIVYGILNAGSSQHGNALRASTASNWVNA